MLGNSSSPDDGAEDSLLLDRFNLLMEKLEPVHLLAEACATSNKENMHAPPAPRAELQRRGENIDIDMLLDEVDALEMMADSAWAAGSTARATDLLQRAIEASHGALAALLRQRQRDLSSRISCGGNSPPPVVVAQVSCALANIKALQNRSACLHAKLGERKACLTLRGGAAASPVCAGLQCPQCQREIVASSVVAPRFCSHCGSPTPPRLGEVRSSPVVTQVVARRLY